MDDMDETMDDGMPGGMEPEETVDGLLIEGGNGPEMLMGDAGPDTIEGGNGSDTIDGKAGDDSIEGGNAADYLIGGEGNDTIVGGNGPDTIVGGAGDDLLFGGNGPDSYLSTLDGAAIQFSVLGDTIMFTTAAGAVSLVGFEEAVFADGTWRFGPGNQGPVFIPSGQSDDDMDDLEDDDLEDGDLEDDDLEDGDMDDDGLDEDDDEDDDGLEAGDEDDLDGDQDDDEDDDEDDDLDGDQDDEDDDDDLGDDDDPDGDDGDLGDDDDLDDDDGLDDDDDPDDDEEDEDPDDGLDDDDQDGTDDGGQSAGLLIVGAALSETLVGTDAGDTISGGNGEDTVAGGAGDDLLDGGNGKDTMTGDGGDDLVIGGNGVDCLVLDAAIDDVTLGQDEAGRTTATLPDGSVDTLESVEKLTLTDGFIFLNDAEAAGDLGFVTGLFYAALTREPGPGIEFWMTKLDEGASRVKIAEQFVTSEEFEAILGAASDDEEFIRQMFREVIGREAGEGGLAHWSGRMAEGMTEAEVLVAFTQSEEYQTRIDDMIGQGLVIDL